MCKSVCVCVHVWVHVWVCMRMCMNACVGVISQFTQWLQQLQSNIYYRFLLCLHIEHDVTSQLPPRLFPHWVPCATLGHDITSQLPPRLPPQCHSWAWYDFTTASSVPLLGMIWLHNCLLDCLLSATLVWSVTEWPAPGGHNTPVNSADTSTSHCGQCNNGQWSVYNWTHCWIQSISRPGTGLA